MNYRYQKPHQLLSEDVRTVLIADTFGDPDDSKLPLYTNGMPALFCRTRKDPTGIENILQLTLFGKSTPADSWEAKKNETIMAWFFKPFAIAPVFNITAADLMKAPIDLDQWNGHKTNALKTQLVYAAATSQKVSVLENLLIHQVQQQKTECEIIRYATDQMMHDSGNAILSEIQKALKLNERTFQRIFKKYVGITPNQFRRICQFQLSFSQLKEGKFDNLTDVAFGNGFADQSHFIRSFKEFVQLTPKQYIRSGLKPKKK
jgi:AraC-like DNA-binding protein